MILPDVNVLIYAFRADVPQHSVCRPWIEKVVEGDARFGIAPMVLSAVVRITTDRRIFQPPSTLDEAFRFCHSLLGQPHCERVEPGKRHWEIFYRLCVETETHGPEITDAWYAALAIEWGCEWITMDRDFARFPGLRWRMPEVLASH